MMALKECRNIIVLFVMLLMTGSIHAQSKTITGKVTTYKTIAIKNAKITVKKSKLETYTDSLGNFTLACNLKDKITIKAVGFKVKTIKIKNDKDSLKINMEVEGDESDLELAFAHGHITNRDLKQAKIYYNTVEPYSLGFTNIKDLLKAKFPQATVTDDEIVIRGSNTISEYTSNAALIVLNGTLSSMSALKSIDLSRIKTIKILRGAAAHRFGTGSGNGVFSVELLSN